MSVPATHRAWGVCPAGAGEDAPLGGVQNSRLRALRLRALRVHPEDVDLLLPLRRRQLPHHVLIVLVVVIKQHGLVSVIFVAGISRGGTSEAAALGGGCVASHGRSGGSGDFLRVFVLALLLLPLLLPAALAVRERNPASPATRRRAGGEHRIFLGIQKREEVCLHSFVDSAVRPRSEHLEHAVEEPGVQRLGVSRAGVYGQGTSHAGTE
mmetsp:Transcript_35911/g.57755  ORF Transcript_35911/g.57755 Transcript_35911/m.57755 type:complete len:210 (-) Transcript_35911:133-762(-)